MSESEIIDGEDVKRKSKLKSLDSLPVLGLKPNFLFFFLRLLRLAPWVREATGAESSGPSSVGLKPFPYEAAHGLFENLKFYLQFIIHTTLFYCEPSAH